MQKYKYIEIQMCLNEIYRNVNMLKDKCVKMNYV